MADDNLDPDMTIEEAVQRVPDLTDAIGEQVDTTQAVAEIMAAQGLPEDVKGRVREIGKLAPCGGRVTVEWTSGAWRGMPITFFCWEPNCISNGGTCTGPRMVPHTDQFTISDPLSPFARRRQITAPEIMAGVAQANRRVREAVGVADTRSEKEIAEYIAKRWAYMKAAEKSGTPWDL